MNTPHDAPRPLDPSFEFRLDDIDPERAADPRAVIAAARREAAHRRGCGDEETQSSVRLGGLLGRIARDRLFVLAGCATFEAFLAQLELDKDDAEACIKSRVLDPAWLAGRSICAGKLAQISAAPPWLMPELCFVVDRRTDRRKLGKAIRQARRARDQGGLSEADAIKLALRVLAEPTRAAPKKGRAATARQHLGDLVRDLVALRRAHQQVTDEWRGQVAPLLGHLVEELAALAVPLPPVLAPAAPTNDKNGPNPAPDKDLRGTKRAPEVSAAEAKEAATKAKEDAKEAAEKPKPEPAPPPEPAPTYAPWPPPPPTRPEDELVRAGDPDAADAPNPIAVAALSQVPEIEFQGQRYPLSQIGAAFAGHFDEYHQNLLCEGLCFLIGVHGKVDWQELGKLRLRNMARMVEEQGGLPAELPPGLLPAWAARCAESDLAARFPLVLGSLRDFRLASFRHYVHLLAERCAEQPYRAVFEAAADATPRTDVEDWQRHAPDDYQAFLRERQRLLGEKRPYDVALAEAQARVRAARRARGLR